MKSVPGIIVCALVMVIALGSCDRNEAVVATSVSTVEDPDKEQKVVFAKALARAVAAEPAVRSFLKQESQKMIDEDFDVVYALVRDVELSNGRTLRETLLPYFSTPAELTAIEERLPLLTIFVPTLPDRTFSARD
ncbi:hypothetical protein [Chryseolinea lacunae]|uniref:DUF4476 domain-containing protein n=1 Tax=Chryseolinea lacunae TaxID=2801331 RepID=A0ABS1KWP6_9BACT|nr:hypothetical protein [Chryseolinea lacunae]MBL0743891.1 hypothetical protein [Chryseolinea lacunae]